MSVRMSLLAILDQGHCYGYQLKAEFDRRTGSTWPLNVGQIYSTLERLERDGLVRPADADSDGQNYFEITDAGRAEMISWLDSPVVKTSASRDELAIKLAMVVTLPGVDVVNVIQLQRRATLTTLRDLTRTKSISTAPESSEDLAWSLVVDSLIFAAEAEVRWLDHSESVLIAAIKSGIATPSPLNTEIPKRGRPAKSESRSSAVN